MRLETSLQLLERLRSKCGSSWYGLAPILGTHKNSVANWKNGRTTVDRKFAARIAELLGEPPEYVLACLEAEKDPGNQQLWQRIAMKFRAHAASILLAGLALAGLSSPTPSEAYTHAAKADAEQCILSKIRRALWKRLRAWLSPFPVSFVTAPAL